MKERPSATVSERRRFLACTTGKALSDSTVRRLLRRMGFSQKKRAVGAVERDEWLRAAWRVTVTKEIGPKRLVFVDEMGTNTSLSVLRAWSRRGQRAYYSVPRSRGPNITLLSSMTMEGMGPSLVVEGTTTKAVFEAYVERVLLPTLRPGQVVVMDNLTAHKGERVRKLIEGRGCDLLYLPPYSPDFNPIEEAFAKIKGILRKAEARSCEALIKAISQAISAVTELDARGCLEHCGYVYYPPRCVRQPNRHC